MSGVVPRLNLSISLPSATVSRFGVPPLRSSGLGLLVGSRDCAIPGNCILVERDGSTVSSTWFLRKAAEPRPLSCVCRNHAGSFCARDAAMSDLEGSSCFSYSGDWRGRFRTEAKPERGLWRALSFEAGLCCHDRVPLRAKPAAPVGLSVGISVVGGDGRDRIGAGSGSRVGDVLPLTALDRDRDADGGANSTGGLTADAVVDESKTNEDVLAGPVLDGEIERALSAILLLTVVRWIGG